MIRSFVFSQKQGKLVGQDLTLDLLRVVLFDEGIQFWVDASECSDEEVKQLLEGVFNFHPLAIEDCIAPSERPKVDEYENCLFMVIHTVDYSHETHQFKTTELNMFIGSNFLVTVHHDPMRCVAATIDRIMKNAPAVARAPDRLTYTLLDFVLESYGPAMEELTVAIGELEQNTLQSPSANILAHVIERKAEVQRLRQSVWPTREVMSRLAHGQFKIIRPAMLPYYRDLLDQLVRITDQTENYRDSLMNILQIHLNLQQAKVNQVIKVLTVLATLAMPILIVTSFYGMNFTHLPEIHWPFAHFYVMGITGAMTYLLYLFIKRRGWW